MHFYPGVAEYNETGTPYRVFLNEDTIRKMDPSFAGKPVFVQHVEEVEQNVDELRKDADGWVVESFFNSADGKHWVKFIIVSEKAREAIKKGYKLSNAYLPKGPRGPAAQWNGVKYDNQIMNAEYEHLAIVPNPRYEESVIMTPEQFKKHNESQKQELERIANSKDNKVEPKKENNSMKLKFWKQEKVENASELEGVMVTLPESKKSMTVAEAIDIADKHLNMAGYANGDHMVKVGEEEMSVNDLTKAYCKMNKAAAEEEEKQNKKKNKKKNDDGDDSLDNADDDKEENADDDEDEDDAKKKKNKKKKNSSKKVENDDEDEDDVVENDDDEFELEGEGEHFKALKNAADLAQKAREDVSVDLAQDQLARGQSNYGSTKK